MGNHNEPDLDGNDPDYFAGDGFGAPNAGVAGIIAAVVIVSIVAFAGLWLDAHPGALALFAGSR